MHFFPCLKIHMTEGLSHNQRSKATLRKSPFVFNKIVDAFYYQEIYRGTINVIYQIEQGDEETEFGYKKRLV